MPRMASVWRFGLMVLRIQSRGQNPYALLRADLRSTYGNVQGLLLTFLPTTPTTNQINPKGVGSCRQEASCLRMSAGHMRARSDGLFSPLGGNFFISEKSFGFSENSVVTLPRRFCHQTSIFISDETINQHSDSERVLQAVSYTD